MHKENIENPIFNFLFNKVLEGSLREKYISTISDMLKTRQETSPKQQLESEFSDVTRRIDNLTRAISEGIWSKQTASMLEDLNKRAEELEKKIAYHKMTDEKIISDKRVRFIVEKTADGKRDDPEYLKTVITTLVNRVIIYDHWLAVAINATGNIEQIPPEIIPSPDVLPDGNRFEFCKANAPSLYVAEPYPVIVFKIAI